jgi:hypothetical protein
MIRKRFACVRLHFLLRRLCPLCDLTDLERIELGQ